MRLDTHGYLNWGGRRPKTLVVQVQCATNVNKQRVPVAYAVDTYETLHNPACNMQLLASRGFTTCLGWNKLVDTHSDSLNAFGENTLEPTSNPLLLPPPKRWLVVGL